MDAKLSGHTTVTAGTLGLYSLERVLNVKNRCLIQIHYAAVGHIRVVVCTSNTSAIPDLGGVLDYVCSVAGDCLCDCRDLQRRGGSGRCCGGSGVKHRR